jgi:hypothetical protein
MDNGQKPQDSRGPALVLFSHPGTRWDRVDQQWCVCTVGFTISSTEVKLGAKLGTIAPGLGQFRPNKFSDYCLLLPLPFARTEGQPRAFIN